jgi:DNA-3-methyladenine glycosylase II
LASFYKLAKRDRRLAPLVEEFRGLKPPRFPTVFETVVNGIACQQLSLLVGILLLSRLALRYGQAVGPPDDSLHAFPGPSDLAGVRSQSIRALGFSGHKANFLLTLSSAIRDQGLDLERLARLDNEAAVDFLQGLSGVGRWTAEYVLLRGLGRLDIYPGDDVGARNNLARFLGRRKPLDYQGVRRAVAGWQPYAGFIYFHLLLARIKEGGWLKSNDAENLVTRCNAA